MGLDGGGSDRNSGSISDSYGVKGSASSTNLPGGRTGAVSWADSHGNFWLFGGVGYDSIGNYGYLNDLWEFNFVSMWRWFGNANANAHSNYVDRYRNGHFGSSATIRQSFVDRELIFMAAEVLD